MSGRRAGKACGREAQSAAMPRKSDGERNDDSLRKLLEAHRQERFSRQLHSELAFECARNGCDRHGPWIDEIGVVTDAFHQVELVFRRLVYVEVEKIITSRLSCAEVVRKEIVQSFGRRSLQ